jgi:hypothetical protein
VAFFIYFYKQYKNISMRNCLIVFLLSLYSMNSFAQIKKSQVLVYGDSEASWAAAVQSARSGVKTLWLKNKKEVGIHFSENKRIQISGNVGLDAGLWAEFLQKTRGAAKLSDSVSSLAKQSINAQIAQNVFTGLADSLKNLTILVNSGIKNIKKSGKQWRVTLSNNQKLKLNAIVDGSDDGTILNLLKQQDISVSEVKGKLINANNIYETNLFRTGLLVFEGEEGPSEIPASLLLNSSPENLFIINQYSWLNKDLKEDFNNLSLSIHGGQAIGASAAYCAFFKTTVDKINIRTLQGELLAYHGQLIPFQDIDIQDVHFSEIQRIGAVGVLKGETLQNNGAVSFHFNPKQSVSSKEIQPVLLSLYTRSQIWFSDKDIENLTLSDLLSLIKFTALKGEELDADVKKGWKQRFHFTGEFEPTETLTRRQLAVLIDYYLKPFNIKVDDQGNFKY